MSEEDYSDMIINDWFSLTYSSYLVLPRLILQSMPTEWQKRFVKLLEELTEAIEFPEGYTSQYNVNYREGGKFAKDPLNDYRRGTVELKNV